jgi:hypothetical protein
MAVFSIAPDGGATPLDPVHCRDEDRDLQKLLAQNPEILPGDQIRPEDPCRWLLVRREVPVADPATGSNRWSIDHVFADQDAVPTLVECKRFADSRARREVVGQMLEYAANGQHYWEPEELEKLAVRTAAEAGTSLEEALAALEPTGSQSPEEFFAAFARNLREGRVRLVFFLEEAESSDGAYRGADRRGPPVHGGRPTHRHPIPLRLQRRSPPREAGRRRRWTHPQVDRRNLPGRRAR